VGQPTTPSRMTGVGETPGGLEENENFHIDFIAAGKSFVVADSPHLASGRVRLTHVIAYVRVRPMEPHGSGDRLATASNVEIDRKSY
jgi:hypothetical protein